MQLMFAIALMAHGVAGSTEAPTVEAQGGYLLATGQWAAAAQIAADALHADPTNLDAHNLHIAAWTARGEGARVRASLRTWWSEDKTNPTRRIAFAQSILGTAPAELGSDQCEDLAALLEAPQAPPLEWRRLALRIERGDFCPVSVTSDENALAHLEGNAATQALLKTGLSHPGATRELATLLKTEPWRIRTMTGLFTDDAEGPDLPRTQRRLLSTAKQLSRSDQPVALHASWVILRQAAHPLASRVGQRLQFADPNAQLDVADVRNQRDRWPNRMDTSFEGWRKSVLTQRAQDDDLEAQQLFEDGDHAAAAAKLAEAILAAPTADRHIRLGLSLMATGAEDAAVQHLAHGLALGTASQPLVERARMSLDVLWEDQGRWDPLGPAGLVAAISTVEISAPSASQRPGRAQPFPRLPWSGPDFDQIPGPMVVDVWATWCAPCIEAMPYLDAIAKARPEVTIVGLSVDASPGDLERWLRNHEGPSYDIGWTGPDAMTTLGIDGLPALYVLDAEHDIVAFIRGFQGSTDHRLEDVLDQTAPAPTPPKR